MSNPKIRFQEITNIRVGIQTTKHKQVTIEDDDLDEPFVTTVEIPLSSPMLSISVKILTADWVEVGSVYISDNGHSYKAVDNNVLEASFTTHEYITPNHFIEMSKPFSESSTNRS